MIVKQKGLVTISIDLEVGEKVKIHPLLSPKLKDELLQVESIMYYPACASGVMVKLDAYPEKIDSGWIIKLEKEETK